MKIVADKVSDTSFYISCKKCGMEHRFERCNYRKFCLNDDNFDTFEVNEFGQLEPEFVCRNVNCDFSEKLWIVNLRQE